MSTTTTEQGNPPEMDSASEIDHDDSLGADTGAKTDQDVVHRLIAPEHGGVPLDLDEVFHILQNERRRQVLLHLHHVGGKVAMRDIAEKIAAWENDTTIDNLYSDQRQRVYIALYQSHLPKLDDLGVINYNQARGVIEPTPLVDDIIRYLEVEPASEADAMSPADLAPEWVPPAIAAGLVVITLIAAVWAGVFPTTLLGVLLASAAIGISAAVALITFQRGS